MSYIGNEPIVSATRTVTEVTATAGQTVFTANGGYTVGFLDVFINGSKLTSTDFTATDGSTVTLTEAAQVSDIVRLEALGTFQAANAVLLTGNSNLTGNLNVSGNLGVGTTSPLVPLHVVTSGTGTSMGDNTVATFRSLASGRASTIQLSDNTTSAYMSMLSGAIGFGSAGTERMRIDSSGRVTMPYQPAFHAQVSEGATVSSNTYIVFGTVRVNRGSHYNSSNGRFTVPVSGLYLFYISAINESNNNVSRFTLHINGSVAFGGSQSTQLRLDALASGNEIVNGSKQAILSLNAGDYVQVRYDHDTGSNMNYPDWTNFGGHLLG